MQANRETQTERQFTQLPSQVVANQGSNIQMKRIAVYARYSTDGQKETSIDDQIRACKEAATRQELSVCDTLIFADQAITGGSKGTAKREQYHALRDAVRAGKIDIIFCDQQCRLARHAKESLDFFDDLKRYNVRLLTADGFDSTAPTAQLLFGMKSVFSEFFLDETRHRVARGMKGEFARESMVSAVPYGYQVDAEKSAQQSRCVWKTVPAEADVVREIFERRKAGMSFNQIAAILNSKGICTPRQDSPKVTKPLYWRAAGIWRILQNPIYKGEYRVNFTATKNEPALNLQRIVSELALVSPSDWDTCQTSGPRGGRCAGTPRAPYGGGKHALTGVLRCGVCGATLTCHQGKHDSGSLHCVQCEHATAVGIPGRAPAYVSMKGVRLMLRSVLEKIVTGEVLDRYREQLKMRLTGGREAELEATRENLKKTERSMERMLRLLANINDDDPALEQQYVSARQQVLLLQKQVSDLEAGLRDLNQDVIRKQLEVDLSSVLDVFLTDLNAPERTRALLNRIFPKITLLKKLDRYTAIFEVVVKPGAMLAEASNTAELAESQTGLFLRLNTSGSKNPVWTVDEISANDAALARETAQSLS